VSSNLTITKHFKPLDPKNLAHSIGNHIKNVVYLFLFLVAVAHTKLVKNGKSFKVKSMLFQILCKICNTLQEYEKPTGQPLLSALNHG
jgi:uncharacterized membrane protein